MGQSSRPRRRVDTASNRELTIWMAERARKITLPKDRLQPELPPVGSGETKLPCGNSLTYNPAVAIC